MSAEFRINGRFADQRGIVRRGPVTGHNGEGVPCRRYTWVEPEMPELKGKTFEAFDDQIADARKRAREAEKASRPRAWTAEEVTQQFLDYLKDIARYWASVDRSTSRLITDSKWRPANWQEIVVSRSPSQGGGPPFEEGATAILDALLAEVTKSVEDRILGFTHSLLATIDGTGMIFPSIDLVLRPHPDDKAFHSKEGENWYRNGMAFNASTYLHEILYEEKKSDIPAVLDKGEGTGGAEEGGSGDRGEAAGQ